MYKNKNFFSVLFVLVFSAGMLLSLSGAEAQGLQYQLLEKIPGASALGSDLPGYVKAIYGVALVIVTLSAVLMLSIGGFLYLTSAGNTSAMGTAKSVIFDALIGLTIALAAWLILNVINPDLVDVTLNGLSPVSIPGIPPTGPPPAAGIGAGCGGYAVSGISSSQCNDAGQKLSDVLKCMYDKYPGTKITSISDGTGGFNTCKNNWSNSACAHSQTSCHYGGGVSKTGAECQASQAADFSVRNAGGQVDLAIAKAIMSAGSACGARVNDETSGPAPHVHISTQTSCCSL